VGTRFFAHVQTGPGTHPVSCTMGTRCFPGVKRPGRGADHPPLLAPRSRMSGALPLLLLWALRACYRGNFKSSRDGIISTVADLRPGFDFREQLRFPLLPETSKPAPGPSDPLNNRYRVSSPGQSDRCVMSTQFQLVPS
jgi:hypothetical protein